MPAGRPFQPGQSGNPSGRAKIPPEVKEAARAHTPLAIATLAEVCQSGSSDSARVSAAVALLDRAWGKPEQHVEITQDEGADELRAAIARLRQDPATASAVLLIAARTSVTEPPRDGD